ncbi:MAG: helix-turn-helix transcriptional regulator [Atopobiaceae bacterium]|nr:helix-turn-helix transcriptional regulator [Atopobiaceae bacterium]
MRLQEMRKAAGYKSAREFAEHMGMSVSTYTGYEQGRIKLSLATAWLLADELGCTIDKLAGREVASESPVASPLTESEVRIVSAYRLATPQGRAAIEAVAQSQEGMVGQSESHLEQSG